jgi:iron complex transport system permease protein
MAALLGVALGPTAIPLHNLWLALAGQGDPALIAIVREVRLPRVALAIGIGAGLGMSGAAMQGTLRNGLAEPYLLGVSGGAAVGAVLAISAHGSAGITVPVGAFLGAGVAAVLVLVVARAGGGGRADVRLLLMAGVVVGAFANAAIMVAYAVAPPEAVRGALWWMMGSLSAATWDRVGWLSIYVAIGGLALLAAARQIDVLALGEEAAAALGVRAEGAGRWVYLVAAFVAAATVAAAGLIGFVGLVVPHIVRAGGARFHRKIIGGSALVGAALVVAADVVARTVHPPAELPLGAVTALVGVPFFLVQLRQLAART